MNRHGLYIQLFSLHGLIKGHAPELGRDADTGGQIKYILELAVALGGHPEVERVDVFTRLIRDKKISEEYAKPVEMLTEKVRIVRIACGPGKYIRKELLWPYLDEFIDNTFKFIKKQNRIPDLFHGHYADGGYVAMELAAAFDAPFVFTGHSLGRNKKAKLLAEKISSEKINKHYKIDKRIEVEEQIISQANLIITSTQQEITNQYGLYQNFHRGTYEVIAPGVDLETFYPYYHNQLESQSNDDEVSRQTRVGLLRELYRFWVAPHKPFILALCRPDKRKNIHGLIEAYGKSRELQAIANLAIFAGIRKDIQVMGDNEKSVLTDMLLMMDYYDLYGKLAIPKKHDFESEVPELYRLCAESGGVFINPALVEPFGLTLIEASACGLPIVATNDGGPVDIVKNCTNGILVDVSKIDTMGKALINILADRIKWDDFSCGGINGVRNHYSWQTHCSKTVKAIQALAPSNTLSEISMDTHSPVRKPFGKRLTEISKLLITDIDNTLVGDNEQLQTLLHLLEGNKERVGWGMATGRSLDLTLDIMTEYNIPMPDVLICSVGTEIYYGPDLRTDKGWQSNIAHFWNPEKIKKSLEDLSFLTPQEGEGQRRYKISYYMDDDDGLLDQIHQCLHGAKLRYQLIYSHGKFLDILPYRASKGKAVDYLQAKWEIAPQDIMVAGDSGNDEDMLKGKQRGLVVGNHSNELKKLKGRRSIYFSKHGHAGGIIDGLGHYQFI
ncbi:MAG: HAD-IIB family hydrolase [Desulfobulbaceae bacterium]|nr:HAD-IIB family hydrolase [Desulfobulbaceae bacterium]